MTNLKKLSTLWLIALYFGAFIIDTGFATASVADKAESNWVDSKKSARSLKRNLKKTGRSVTGKKSIWSDVRDQTSDAVSNTQDEANLAKSKIIRKLER